VVIIGLYFSSRELFHVYYPEWDLLWARSVKTFLVSLVAYVTGEVVVLFLHEYEIKIEGKDDDRRIDDVLPFLRGVVRLVVWSVVLILALNIWTVDVRPFVASAGLMGAVVALAGKDLFANLFGGISIFLDKSYRIGDYVVVDEAHRGEVIHIGMRSTKIRTRDNILVTVPNSVMVTNTIINETGIHPELRIRIGLKVLNEENLDEIEEKLTAVAKNHPEVLATDEEHEPRVRYRSFGDSGMELELLCYISKPVDRGRIMHEIIKDMHREMKRSRIRLPYAQRDVNLINK
jgi:small-conductance mechanosensitive channel